MINTLVIFLALYGLISAVDDLGRWLIVGWLNRRDRRLAKKP